MARKKKVVEETPVEVEVKETKKATKKETKVITETPEKIIIPAIPGKKTKFFNGTLREYIQKKAEEAKANK